MKNTVWVVRWEYSDRSSYGNIRAFDTEAAANDLLALLKTHSDTRDFYVDAVEFKRACDD